MAGENTSVHFLQGGSVLELASGGTISISAGGSIQNAGGQSVTNLSATTLTVTNPITLGGTVAKWAFGTVGLTSGVGTIGVPGFTRILSASANPILGEAPGLGSFTTVMVDLSLSGSGSIIFHGGAGTLPYTNNGTVAWMAFGT